MDKRKLDRLTSQPFRGKFSYMVHSVGGSVVAIPFVTRQFERAAQVPEGKVIPPKGAERAQKPPPGGPQDFSVHATSPKAEAIAENGPGKVVHPNDHLTKGMHGENSKADLLQESPSIRNREAGISNRYPTNVNFASPALVFRNYRKLETTSLKPERPDANQVKYVEDFHKAQQQQKIEDRKLKAFQQRIGVDQAGQQLNVKA